MNLLFSKIKLKLLFFLLFLATILIQKNYFWNISRGIGDCIMGIECLGHNSVLKMFYKFRVRFLECTKKNVYPWKYAIYAQLFLDVKRWRFNWKSSIFKCYELKFIILTKLASKKEQSSTNQLSYLLSSTSEQEHKFLFKNILGFSFTITFNAFHLLLLVYLQKICIIVWKNAWWNIIYLWNSDPSTPRTFQIFTIQLSVRNIENKTTTKLFWSSGIYCQV